MSKISERKAKKQKRNFKWLIAVIVIIVIAVIAAVVVKKKGGKNPEDTEMKVQDSKDYVEPGYGALNIDEITGFDSVSSGGEEEKITTTDPGLIIERVGKYTGPFIEDGSDEVVENCLSLIVTNESSEMVQIADITLKLNDKDTVNFKVTNLPGGASTLVMESSRRQYTDGDKFAFEDMNASYLNKTSIMDDVFEITGEDGKLFVKNISQKDYEKVYVYYKYTQLGGAYLGGITYRVPVENIKAGKTVEVVAGHWREGASKLSMVEVAE